MSPRTKQLALVLIPLAVLSMGTKKPAPDSEGGTTTTNTDPLAGDGAKLVGEWAGKGAKMHIGADKEVHFESHQGNTSKKYDGKLKATEPGKLIVNALFDITLNVQKMPTDVDGYTTMTVEGVDLYKGGLAGEIAADITQGFKGEGLVNTVCPPTITADNDLFECTTQGTNFDVITDAGTVKTIKVKVLQSPKGDYHFTLETVPLVTQKLADGIPKTLGPFTITQPNCGSTPSVILDATSSFECTAVDGKTKKPLKVVVTQTGPDNLHFVATPR